MRISLTRKLTYHLLRTYLPSLLFVCLGWMSMFIPIEHIPGRVVMGMTALLTVSSMFGATTTVTPPVSYATKLDFWMVGCICFVFAVLLEFIVVITLKYSIIDRDEGLKEAKIPAQVHPVNNLGLKVGQDGWVASVSKKSGNTNEDARKITRKVDKICIRVYFGVMVIFNIIYWLDVWMTNQNHGQTPKSDGTYDCFRLN
ncbi:glutamate-gated chloride channel alpha-like [Tigriopus californicus]|uniref:glutamate-gated chloride channel alpha-like n=1 Tax=Tigriopus californicus TaxID=6832 RepID=UPI0027DA2D0B|nr:glutamate-gated chloride channel alpha-like [Tigriopus californicus]